MKYLGWILYFSLSVVHAQEVIEPAPLSVEDDGARKIIDRQKGETAPKGLPTSEASNQTAEALVIPNDDVVNPPTKAAAAVVDGQLSLEAPKEQKEQKIQQEQLNIEDKVVAIAVYQDKRTRYLQFSMGYLDSDYEAINGSLKNGSMITSFKFVGDVNQHFQTGFAVEIVADKSGQEIPESIRSLQYRLFADYHAPIKQNSVRIDWVTGLSLAIGDYSIKRRYLNTSGQELSVKLKEGTLIGLIPAIGIRFYLAGQSSFDLMAEYHQYFGNPQSHIGGLAFAPRFNLEF